ncbi:hypothetical protein TNCV_4369621 [Trichonephila clavipes]|nr:hypothetical protein TNCV_4369621 [Trichonephila clavipes]
MVPSRPMHHVANYKRSNVYRNERSVFPGELDRVHSGACKEPLPAPGNRSNERRYKEKDLARTEEKGRNGGEKEKRVAKKSGGREK